MTATDAPRVLMSGIDTLHLFTRSPVRDEAAAQLAAAKQDAVAAARARRELPALELGGHVFRVQPGGARTAPFLLQSEHMAVAVNPRPPRGLPTLIAELRALFLWQQGARAAEAVTEAVAEDLAVAFPVVGSDDPLRLQFQITRIDLTVDFQGWIPPTDPATYTTRAAQISPHYDRKRFTGLSFGRGAIMARLYDKTEEIKVSGKGWFRELWAKCPAFDPAASVWRLEFQLRRGGLRSFRVGARQLSTLADVGAAAGPLWRNLSSRWLAVRQRSANTRQALAPEWAALHAQGFDAGVWNGCAENLYRAARAESAGRSLAQFTGHLRRELATHAFRTGTPADLASTAPRILADARRFAARNGSTLEGDANALAEEWKQHEGAARAGPAAFRGTPLRVYGPEPRRTDNRANGGDPSER